MSVPSQAQLYDEVDRLYHEHHPDAPYKLDPDDPEHRPWVERWLEIRDDVANEWTNEVFFSQLDTVHCVDLRYGDVLWMQKLEFPISTRIEAEAGIAGLAGRAPFRRR